MLRFLILLIVLAAIGIGVWQWSNRVWIAPGPGQKGSVALIAARTSTHDIAHALEGQGSVVNGFLFEGELHLRGLASRVKAGEYAIPAHASMADVAAILISGKSIEHKLTAAEGLTSDMILKIVAEDPILTGNPGAAPPEGALLPETYLFTRGTTRSEIIARMEKAETKFLDQQWAGREGGLPISAPEQAVILASIVEKETSLPEERRHIAAVFVNRLKVGMKLQSDPTIIYGITRGYPLGRGIRESEIQGQSPYNTYVVGGLPPTPICNPGKDSLAAVLNPEDSSDLYFVANGKGGHVFAATMAEHLRNVAAWRAIEKAKEGEPAPPQLRRREHAG